MRGVNSTLASSNSDYHNFVLNGVIDASGDTTSLLNGKGGDASLNFYAFCKLFYDCSSIRKASEVPSSTLSTGCYMNMYRNCDGLIIPPSILPSESVTNDAYNGMFWGCENMASIPNVCSKSSARTAMTSMFRDCKNITNAKLHIDSGMTNTQAMWYMFYNCIGLQDVELQSLGTASSQIFYGCSSMQSLTIYADTPPAINSITFQGMASGCFIYVPDNSVNAYKTAQYWDARASYIKGISEKP